MRSPVVVHLGDYIDHGPDSAGVLSLLLRGPDIPGARCVNLLGEHERMLLDALLTTLGHNVTLCADGEEALARVREAGDAFDLALLDMVMPRRGGRETFLALRELSPGLRILVSSGEDAGELPGGWCQEPASLEEMVLGYLREPGAAAYPAPEEVTA